MVPLAIYVVVELLSRASQEEVVFGESHARKSSSSSSTALEQKYGVDSRPT